MADLNGSEKQVEWADRIRRTVLPAFDRIASKLGSRVAGMDGEEADMATRMLGLIEEARANTSAAWWIDTIGSSAHRHGDIDGTGRVTVYLRDRLAPVVRHGRESEGDDQDADDRFRDLFDGIMDGLEGV